MKRINHILKWFGLIMATVSVVAYKELANWYFLMWIPIVMGYGLFWTDGLKELF